LLVFGSLKGSSKNKYMQVVIDLKMMMKTNNNQSSPTTNKSNNTTTTTMSNNNNSSNNNKSRHISAVAEAEYEKGESHPFLQYYACLSHQQNMLQDLVRTSTYRHAMLSNGLDFKDKVVLDVGAGTGILSVFAAQCGARKVYAVEASDMAEMASKIIHANNLDDVIVIVKGKIETVELPELVDVIVSEPMGFLLVHERMLESYLVARDRFLKKPSTSSSSSNNNNTNNRGIMFPSMGKIRVLPFSDPALHSELVSKSLFWRNTNFLGVDLTCLEGHAIQQSFSQPVIGYVDPSVFISREEPSTYTFDFTTCTVHDDLEHFTIPVRFVITKTSLMHGFICWFDVDFIGSQSLVTLSTGPRAPGTHWYQIRLLLAMPLAVNMGQIVSGTITMKANKKFSYDIDIYAQVDGVVMGNGNVLSSTNSISLHDPYYHYLSSPAAAQPNVMPSNSDTSQYYGTNNSNNNNNNVAWFVGNNNNGEDEEMHGNNNNYPVAYKFARLDGGNHHPIVAEHNNNNTSHNVSGGGGNNNTSSGERYDGV
jgi:histone-arginine methyltransferase CARM1